MNNSVALNSWSLWLLDEVFTDVTGDGRPVTTILVDDELLRRGLAHGGIDADAPNARRLFLGAFPNRAVMVGWFGGTRDLRHVAMLDGCYLTAIVIGPHSIPPDEWFVDLLGECGRIASASGQTLAAITAIIGRFNAISEGLSRPAGSAAADIRDGKSGTPLHSNECGHMHANPFESAR